MELSLSLNFLFYLKNIWYLTPIFIAKFLENFSKIIQAILLKIQISKVS